MVLWIQSHSRSVCSCPSMWLKKQLNNIQMGEVTIFQVSKKVDVFHLNSSKGNQATVTVITLFDTLKF